MSIRPWLTLRVGRGLPDSEGLPLFQRVPGPYLRSLNPGTDTGSDASKGTLPAAKAAQAAPPLTFLFPVRKQASKASSKHSIDEGAQALAAPLLELDALKAGADGAGERRSLRLVQSGVLGCVCKGPQQGHQTTKGRAPYNKQHGDGWTCRHAR